MARNSNKFKTQRRMDRIQNSTERFDKGMYFTKAPLNEGFIREMVNFDTKDSGEVLLPRPGLRQTDYDAHAGAVVYDSDMQISYAKNCTESDNETYKQAIIGIPTANKLTGTNLYKGSGYVGTGISNGLTLEVLASGGDSILFKKPSGGTIHGVDVSDLASAGRQVGTFAYNDDFYYFKDSGKLAYTNFDAINSKYVSSEVTPRGVDIKEAIMWGYNMLSTTPYTFADGHTAAAIQLGGVAPYDSSDNIIPYPLVNQPITLRAQYDALTGDKYTIVWEWKEYTSATWEEFKSQEVTFAADTVLEADFSAPVQDILIRVSAYKWSGSPLAEETTPTQVLPIAMSFRKTSLGEATNLEAVNYSLHTATGMTFWKQRLVVYGVKEDKTVLFVSDPNDPTYFPYPNNVDIFNEPIIHVSILQDQMLVFTTTEIYTLTLSDDGLSWTKKLIQDRLRINDWDTHLIQNIKNMVYFRSGDYYYMIVPSSRLVGNLTVAPISKNIEAFFDEFEDNVAEVVKTAYDYSGTLTLVNYYNYLDFEDVCNVYVYQTDDNVYLNFVLRYNTLLRSWRIYIHESENMLIPFQQDITKRGTLISLFEFDGAPAVQLLEYNPLNVSDYYIPTGLTTLDDAETTFATINTFKNYQYLDTGYRELNSDFKKRFREMQMKFNNVSESKLNFYTDYFIDGDQRKSSYEYGVVHNTDPLDPNFGLITFERSLVDPLIVPGATTLDSWELDVSQFPELSFWKIRFPVSGKGYAPRLRLISYNEKRYELLNLIWVYRPMYSR